LFISINATPRGELLINKHKDKIVMSLAYLYGTKGNTPMKTPTPHLYLKNKEHSSIKNNIHRRC
jgi:hypothetical protein